METIKARPLTLADFEDGTIAKGTEVYWRREHAGDVTWDPATVERFNQPQITTTPNSFGSLQQETGDGRWFTSVGSLSVASVYGTTATFAPHRSGEEVYIADEEGEEIPLTPAYGSMVSLTVTMPGVSPEEAEEALGAFMRGLASGRVKTLKARPLADRRVNIYDNDGGQKGQTIALNVLEGEAHTVSGYMCSIVDVVSREEFERNMALLREVIGDSTFDA